jgi:hypothetical protein
MPVFRSYAGNQLLQRISAPPPFWLRGLDTKLAVTHLHVGRLANPGPYFFANALGIRSARLLPHFKNFGRRFVFLPDRLTGA